jgi:drug/metabolite transporter (DMT)-like permease
MLLLANVFWGLSFPVIKVLVTLNASLVPAGGGAFAVAYAVAPRFLVALAVLLAWQFAARRGGMTAADFRRGIFIGLFGAAGMLLQNDGLRFTAASTSAFLTQLYAILIPVWLALRHRRNPGLSVWLGCALVLAGVAILGRLDLRALRFGRGEWETLLCSVFFMVQILALDDPRISGSRPEKLLVVWFGVEAAVFFGLAAASAPAPSAFIAPWAVPAWLACTLLLTLFCTLGAFSIMIVWQPRITATEAGLIYCTEPIFGSLFAGVLPAAFSRWAGIGYANEKATVNLLLGGGLITLANVLVQLRPPRRPAPPVEAPESTPRPAE